MTDRQNARPSLTEEQKAKVKATTEKDANLVELQAEELEQRIDATMWSPRYARIRRVPLAPGS